MNTLHKNITVYGIVQGVGFRFSARRMASALGLKGNVRNQYDGSVFIEVEGSEFQVQKFIDWCKHGPDGARVDNISVSDGKIKDYKAFDVRF